MLFLSRIFFFDDESDHDFFDDEYDHDSSRYGLSGTCPFLFSETLVGGVSGIFSFS